MEIESRRSTGLLLPSSSHDQNAGIMRGMRSNANI